MVYRFSLQAAERRVPLVWLLQGGARPSAIFTFFTGSQALFESSPDLWMFEVQGGSYLEPTRGDRAISSSFWRHASHLDWKKNVRDSFCEIRNSVFAWRPHTRNAVWEGTHHWEDVLLVCWTLQHYQAQTKQRKADQKGKSKVNHDETIRTNCQQMFQNMILKSQEYSRSRAFM